MNAPLDRGINNQSYFVQFLYLFMIFMGCVFLFFLISVAVLSISGLGLNFLESLSPGDLTGKQLSVLKLLQVLQTIVLFIVPAVIFSWLKRKSFAYFGFEGKISFGAILLTLGMVVCCFPLVAVLAYWNQGFALPDTPFFNEIEAWMRNSEKQAEALTIAFLKMKGLLDLFINIIMVAVLAAIGEELFFRGTVQRFLEEWIGNGHGAVFIAAFAFSFFHFQFYGFVPRFLLGLFLGYLLLWSSNIWYPIIAHFVYNGVQVLGTYQGLMDAETAIPDDAIAQLLPAAGLCVLLLGGLGYVYFGMFNRKMEQVA